MVVPSLYMCRKLVPFVTSIKRTAYLNNTDWIICRLHLALRTYKELLETLQAMSQSASSAVRDSAKVIQQNVFYLQEYRDIILTLLKKFDNTRQSK